MLRVSFRSGRDDSMSVGWWEGERRRGEAGRFVTKLTFACWLLVSRVSRCCPGKSGCQRGCGWVNDAAAAQLKQRLGKGWALEREDAGRRENQRLRRKLGWEEEGGGRGK